MSSADTDLNDWIRDRTQLGFPQSLSDRSAHCLQSLYPSGILWSRLQIPAFVVGRTIRSQRRWPISDFEKENRKKLSWIELIDQVTDLIRPEDEDAEDTYQRLSDRASDIEKQLERLERSIDRRFKATEIGESVSNTVCHAYALLVQVNRALSNHSPDASFGSTRNDLNTENRRWNLSAALQEGEVSGDEVEEVLREESFPSKIGSKRQNPRLPISKTTVYDIHPPSGLNIEVDDLHWTQERPCVEVSSYDCGLSHLPADATVIEVQRICRAYFEQLEAKALKAGNTHALLCFRLHHIRRALRAHNLYGDLKGYARGLDQEIQGAVEYGSKVGAPPKTGRGVEMKERTKAIINRLYDRDFWHLEGRHTGKPKWEKIVRDIDEDSPNLVRARGESDPISGERAKQIIDQHDDLDLNEIRREAGAPEPS